MPTFRFAGGLAGLLIALASAQLLMAAGPGAQDRAGGAGAELRPPLARDRRRAAGRLQRTGAARGGAVPRPPSRPGHTVRRGRLVRASRWRSRSEPWPPWRSAAPAAPSRSRPGAAREPVHACSRGPAPAVAAVHRAGTGARASPREPRPSRPASVDVVEGAPAAARPCGKEHSHMSRNQRIALVLAAVARGGGGLRGREPGGTTTTIRTRRPRPPRPRCRETRPRPPRSR